MKLALFNFSRRWKLHFPLLLVIFALFAISSKAQFSSVANQLPLYSNYSDFYKRAEAYIDSIEPTIDSSLFYAGCGDFKAHKRFTNQWNYRLYPDKEIGDYFNAQYEYYTNQTTSYNYATEEEWYEIGPKTTQQTGFKGIGPMEFLIFFDDGTAANTKYVLSGSLNSGLFFSTNSGESWISAGTDDLPQTGIGSAVFHPTDHSTWFASSSGNDFAGEFTWIGKIGGIFRTNNEGVTWYQIANYEDLGGELNKIYKIVIDPTNPDILYAATYNGIYRTYTANALPPSKPTWTRVYNSFVYDIEVKPGNSQVLYASGKNNNVWTVLRSTNQGLTWTPLPTQPMTFPFNSNVRDIHVVIEVSKARPGYLYCHARDIYYENIPTDNNKFYYYVDLNSGNTWNTVAELRDKYNYGWGHGFGVEQASTGLEMSTSFWMDIEKINISTGILSGQTVVHDDVEDIVYHPYNVGEVWSATHGGIEKFSGGIWQAKYDGLGVALIEKFATSYTDPKYIALGLFHDGVQITQSSEYLPNNWTPNWYWSPDFFMDGYQPLIDNKSINYMWASGQRGNWYLSYDQFQHNTYLPIGPSRFASYGVLNKVSTNILYVNKIRAGNLPGEKCEEVFKCPNKGLSNPGNTYISDFKALYPNCTEIIILGLYTSDLDENTLFINLLARNSQISGFHVLCTRNANATNVSWEEIPLPSNGWMENVVQDANEPKTIYIAFGRSSDDSNFPYGKDIIYKIDCTTPGSPIYTNMTYNLPYTFVKTNSIASEKNSNHGLYLATEFGVFYTNNDFKQETGNEWRLVGNGLPHIPANGIEINYVSSKLRVATCGRGVWEIPLPCVSSTTAMQILTNTVINTDARFDRDIIIKSGNSLTINNGAHVYMAETKKIVVEPGAKLYVNNATLSSGCNNSMWEGIQVWGDENQHQWEYGTDIYYQGYVNLLDATIKDAKCALNLWNPSQWGTTGGIVIATNSHFINNTQSVHALNYKNYHPVTGLEMDYQAILKNCDFSLDKNYIGTYEFFKHIDLASVRGVKFYGCDFDLSREAPNVNMYNQAIAAYSAGFVATSYCTDNFVPCGNTDVCIFKNFHTGITVRNWDSPYTFYAKDCIFDNLVYGVNNYAGNFSTIVNNQFNVGSTNFEELCAFGINQRMATGFAIENNTFGFLQESICNDHYGIHTMNTNGVDEIYRNSFTDLKYANFASNRNHAGQYQVYGLSYICNQNDRNYADFYIQDNYLSMIQHNQGDRLFPAGNTFSRTGAIHLYNGNLGGFLAYHYNPLITAQSPDPLKVFGNVNLIQAIGENPCNIHYGGTKEDVKLTGEEKLATEFEYADALYNFNSINELYTSLLDGGSTENKLLEVTTATENDAWILRNSLLGSSPHLTETVLKAMSERTDILSESTIFEILSANPDELRKEELIKYLEEKENPLPDYMIDILKQLAIGNSYRTTLESEMARYDRIRVRAANDMIRCYLNESPVNYAIVRDWLDNLGGLNADRQIISTYVQANDFTTALNLANLLPTLYEFSQEELNNHNDYIYLLTLQQNLFNEGRHFEELTGNEISVINAISLENSDLAGVQALGIMEAYQGTYYGNCPNPEDLLLNKSVLIDQAQLAKAYGIELIVNPNPANQWAAFDYKMPTKESSGEIIIFNSQGTPVSKLQVSGDQGQVTIDSHTYKNGAYFYQFKTGLVILSGKIIVIH